MSNSTSPTPRKRDASGFDNSNSGALWFNGAPLAGATLRGEWLDAQSHKFRLAISADIAGARTLAVMSKEGKLLRKGAVIAVPGTGKKMPAYRGTIGSAMIVLWDMGTYYQVRPDHGIPAPTASDEVLAALGIGPDGMSAAQAKREGPSTGAPEHSVAEPDSDCPF
jgi:hypothetical protein